MSLDIASSGFAFLGSHLGGFCQGDKYTDDHRF